MGGGSWAKTRGIKIKGHAGRTHAGVRLCEEGESRPDEARENGEREILQKASNTLLVFYLGGGG